MFRTIIELLLLLLLLLIKIHTNIGFDSYTNSRFYERNSQTTCSHRNWHLQLRKFINLEKCPEYESVSSLLTLLIIY